MKYIQIKNYKLSIFIFTFFVLLILNITNVFAGGWGNETDVAANTMMDNPRLTYKSEYASGEGYEKVVFTMPRSAEEKETYELHYYHYARVRIEQDGTERTIPLWLYRWTNQVFDEELKDEMKRTRDGGVSMLGFYDPTGETNAYVPDEDLGVTYMNYFMWPISSTGRGLVYDEPAPGYNKEVVLDHDINDFTHIKKSSNFSLAFILDENTSSYGSSYLSAGYKYPVPGQDSAKFKKYLESAEDIIGYEAKWGSTNYLSKNYLKFYGTAGASDGSKTYNGNFNDEGQTFIEHINYAKSKGSESAAIAYTRTMRSTEEGYETKSPYLFLTYKDSDGDTTPVYPRIVWNADSLGVGYPREVANYSRSLNVTSDGSYNTITGQIAAYGNGRDTDGWATAAKLDETMGVLNRTLVGLGISSLNNYTEYYKVHDKAISTFWSFCRVYQGFYYDIASWTKSYVESKNYSGKVLDLTKKLPKNVTQFNRAGTGKSYTTVYDKVVEPIEYSEFYEMSKLMTMTMARYYMISGFSCKETTATLYVKRSDSGYRSFDSVMLHYELPVNAAVTPGDVAITNLDSNQSVMNNLTVVDLRKALGVSNSDYSSFVGILDELRGTAVNYNAITIDALLNKLTTDKITFFTSTSGKRAATLLLNGFQSKDVGIYLTNPEMEKGQVAYNAGTKTLENLDSETVYVLATTLQYLNKYDKTKIPDILAPKYNIGYYSDIGIESQEFLDDEKRLEKREKLKTTVSTMAYPLFKEQANMFANNPRVQMMMIVSGTDKYAGKETTVWTTAKKYLTQISSTLYNSKFNTVDTKNTLTQNYFYELFKDKGTLDIPLINSNSIKFSTSEGSRLSGFTYISTDAARYFEIVDADFTTSDIGAQGKLLSKTSDSAKVLINYDAASALGNFVKRNNSYSLKSTDVFGYFNLNSVYQTGIYDGSNCLTYFATFYVPKYASKIVSGTVYTRTIDGKLDTAAKSAYTMTGVKSTVTGTNLAPATRGVKFISRIATNASGIFEDYSELEAVTNPTLKSLATYLNDNYMTLGNIKKVSVIISNPEGIVLNDEGTLIITVSKDTTRDAFGNAVKSYLKKCLAKTDTQKLRLTALRSDLDMEQAYSSLGVNATTAILLSLYIQDYNKFNNVSYIATGVNIPPEDIVVANALNTDVDYDGTAENRKSIDWTTDGSSNYELKASLTLNGDNTLGSNILTGTNIVNSTDSMKIRSKNTTLSTPTESTKVYGDVFIGRVPEAKKTGLYVGDYKMIMYEKFNEKNFNASTLNSLTTVGYIKSALDAGKTQSELIGYFDNLDTYYYSAVLYNLALGKSSLGNIKITPIAYKKVANEADIFVLNNKVSQNLTMTNWTNIASEADTAKLAFSPGMIVKYRWEYNLPYGTQSTTIKYMNAQAGKLYKSSFSTLTALSSLELNFVLTPAMKADGTIKNTKSVDCDATTKNNFTKMSTTISDGGNLTFVGVTVQTATTKQTVYTQTYTYDNALNADGALDVYISKGNLPKDSNGNIKEDLKVSVKVYYKNLFDSTKTSKNSILPIKVSNYFYSAVRTGTIVPSNPTSGPYKEGEITYNGSFTDSTYLYIPTTQNFAATDYLEIVCPGTDPRDYADNIIDTDLEKINIMISDENPKDNAVSDIILYKNSVTGTVLGDNNEDSTNNLLSQSIMQTNTDITRVVQVRTKVKRISGTKTEEKYGLYLNLAYTRDAQKVEEYRILTSYNSSVSTSGGLKGEGSYVCFDSPVVSASKQISAMTVEAQYRTSDNMAYYDSGDSNMSNNLRVESWVALFDIAVDLDKPNDLTIYLKKGQDPYTTPINPKATFTANARVDVTVNGGAYIGEAINADVTVYLLNVANNARYYPDTVSGLTNYSKSGGTGKLAINGGMSTGLSLNFKDLPLVAGDCKIYISVKPDKYQLAESNPWNADPAQSNNSKEAHFNVNIEIEDQTKEYCTDPNKTPSSIYWNTQFQWSNMVRSRPVQTDQWYSYTDKNGTEHRYFVCCSCNSQSGRNNWTFNWGPNGDRYNSYGVGQGPYYETVTATPYIWTSSSGWQTVSYKEVYTGEAVRVRLKVTHSSNRDVLPNALYYDEMGYNTPYSMNGIGHAWGCDYLSRWPGVSRIDGPQNLQYTISGTRGFDKNTVEPYDSIEVNGMVDRTVWWDLLPQVSIPVTNKTQNINISYALVPYWGYNFSTDPLHTAKQLCTRGSISIKISPSTTIPGDDEYEGSDIDTGVE